MAMVLGWLALLVVVYFWHMPLLVGSFYDPHLITFIHVNTLGVIGATILGASYQLLPVVLGVPLASVRLARLSWWLYTPGLLLFVLGLSQRWLMLLGAGGVLLGGGVALYVGIVAFTLRSAPHRDVVAWHIAASIVGLATGATLGVLLALSKGTGFLGGMTFAILGAHVVLMLGGWVTPMLMGVAYRLVGMFTLSEDKLNVRWAWVGLVLATGGAWTLAGCLLFGGSQMTGTVAAGALLGGVSLFALQLMRLYRVRRRRQPDVHIPFALTAATFGLLASGLVFVGFATGRPLGDPVWVAAGWWAIAGFAETAIQGFLYKIGPFLTWLRRYAPVAGQRPVPRLEDLYERRIALAGWACWTTGTFLGGLAALTRGEGIATAAAIGLSAGAGLFLVNAARVGAHWRLRNSPPKPEAAFPTTIAS
jgi:hypothetical protein